MNVKEVLKEEINKPLKEIQETQTNRISKQNCLIPEIGNRINEENAN